MRNIKFQTNGRVKSKKTGTILKQYITKKGYCQITLRVNNKAKTFLVHRLVAEAFIPNSDKKDQVNHKDTNKQNNRVFNLEWATNAENIQHATKKGLREKVKTLAEKLGKKYGKANGKKRAKSINQYDLKENFLKTWESATEVQRQLNINHGHISECCRGERQTAGGYKWKYTKNT